MYKKLLILSSLAGALFFQSCSDDDFGGNVLETVDFTTDVKFKSNKQEVADAKITLRNVQTGAEYVMQTNENGKSIFENVLPGNYDITVSISLTPTQYELYFGFPPADNENIDFNGIAENVTINTTHTSISIELDSADILEGLVIKQIHYGGSHTQQGASFRDQFVEIYNNSNEIIYADGLLFAQLFGNNTATNESFTLPSRQYDWSQAEGNTKGEAANTDYVYADYIYRIPGTGMQYPIQPGESIVIAATAINHKANYTDNDGNEINIQNPDLTIDLSNADFEANLTSFTGNNYRYDIQNPAVPDLEIVHFAQGQDMVLDSQGRDGYIIFRATADEISGYSIVKHPKPGESRMSVQIPNTKIIDGVDTTRDLGNNLVPKKLISTIDAGKTYLLQGAYTSTSVIRKTAKTINGRIVLQDSNNSTEDFVNIKATPKVFAN